MLKSAQKGAESVGAETEYIDLYALNFTGCRSCLACKRKGAEPCKCYWKDDLSPVLDKILAADALFLGSPIYLSDMSSSVHALLERLVFIMMTYNDENFIFKGKVNLGVILTMNWPEEMYEKHVKPQLAWQLGLLSGLGGRTEILPSFDTQQVNDYGKYEMAIWDESKKKARHETQFPIDLQKAFELGAKLSR